MPMASCVKHVPNPDSAEMHWYDEAVAMVKACPFHSSSAIIEFLYKFHWVSPWATGYLPALRIQNL